MHFVLLTAAALLAWPGPSRGNADRVEISTQDQLTLTGSFWAPKGKQASPGAVLIHGGGGSRMDLEDYAERLSRMGFAVLSVDLRGHGDSATPELDWSHLDAEGREHLWALATRDVKACVDFLVTKREVQSAALVLVGHRAGATLVTRHAVRDENVRAIALLDPPAVEKEMLGFQLSKDIEALGGLPTRISVPKDSSLQAERLVADGQRANGGLDFIQLSIFKGSGLDLLTDSREASDVTKWLKERAFPSKGR